MKNINELFNNRDMIIESIGYFNPLILEECDNVVITEGFVGGIVEKIKALGRLIKKWIQKIIDWVADKLGMRSKQPYDTKNKNDEKKVSDVEKELEEIEKTKKDLDKDSKELNKENEKLIEFFNIVSGKMDSITEKDFYANILHNDDITENIKDMQVSMYKARRIIEKNSEKLAELPKKIEEEKKTINEIKSKLVDHRTTKVKVPDLNNLLGLTYNILGECHAALQEENPSDYFKGRSIQGYFLKSNDEKILSVKDFLKNDNYMSYSCLQGKRYLNEIKKFVKETEDLYTKLENDAKNTNDPDEAKKLLNKAKNVNTFLQTTLSDFVKYADYYVTKIDKIEHDVHIDQVVLKRKLYECEERLEYLEKDKNGYVEKYLGEIRKASQLIRKCNNEIRSKGYEGHYKEVI